MGFPTPDADYNATLGANQSIIYNLWHRNNSQPAIGNTAVNNAVYASGDAIAAPIASVVTPIVNAAGNVANGASNIIMFGALGLGAIVLLKILK